MSLEDLLPFKKQKPVQKPTVQKEEHENLEVSGRVYKLLVERYAEHINKNEIKTIPELKQLVNPSDETIISVKNSLKADSEENFASKAFEYVKKLDLVELDSDVSFWLSPKEIIELQASDSFDKAIFLCSLLQSDNIKAKIRVLEFSDSSRRPIVTFELNEKNYVAEFTSNLLKQESADEFEKEIKFGDSVFVKVLFEFDDKNYEDFQQ